VGEGSAVKLTAVAEGIGAVAVATGFCVVSTLACTTGTSVAGFAVGLIACSVQALVITHIRTAINCLPRIRFEILMDFFSWNLFL